jgi:hypothetical protein
MKITEDVIQSVYDSLDAEKIKKFIGVVEHVLDKSLQHPQYELIKSIKADVLNKQSLSFKQFRAMYFFVMNYKNRTDVKTF